MVQTTKLRDENQRWKLFVTRFFDCDMCRAGHTSPTDLVSCMRAYRDHYTFAYCRLYRSESFPAASGIVPVVNLLSPTRCGTAECPQAGFCRPSTGKSCILQDVQSNRARGGGWDLPRAA